MRQEAVVEVYCRAASHGRKRAVVRRLRVVWAELENGTNLTPFRVVDPESVTLHEDQVLTDAERGSLASAIRAGAVEHISALPELRPKSVLPCPLCHLEVRVQPETMAPFLGKVIMSARRAGVAPTLSLADLARRVAGR